MTENSSRGFPRPIDSTLHGVTDYTVGATLMTVFPRLVGIEGTPAAKQIRVAGAIHAGYSTLTDYPLGIAKVIPYQAHLALDAIGALALAATPFVTGQYKKGTDQWVSHVALCVFELTSLMFSDPSGRGDYKADVPAVQRSNMEDPHRKIYDGTPAVTPGTA
ncbi:MAG TPA: hypothetical protein VNC17_12455 [Thermoleophilaceae bacterium]|jgi:hypothetical protein|nr:hypothetical protein [Thermoleophilaceae bacterium]